MRKFIAVLLVLILALALFAGCAATKSTSITADTHYNPLHNEAFAEESSEYNTAAPMDIGNGERTTNNISLPAGRKIILNASLEMEAIDFDKTHTDLITEIKNNGGYISSSSQRGSKNSTEPRYLAITARIPTDKYQTFMSTTAEIGNIIYKQEGTDDITAQYTDIEVRLATLAMQEERLLEILSTANDLESIITLESKLSEVRYQIESYTQQKRGFDSLVEYSTIDISLQEVKSLTETKDGFGTRIWQAVKGSLNRFALGTQDFVIGFIYFIPTLLVMALIVFIIVVIFKKSKAKKANKPLPPAPNKDN